MAGFLIIAHEPLASALAACATHVYSVCPASVEALDVPADADMGEMLAAAELKLGKVKDSGGALVLTDVFGASPSNVAQKLVGPYVRVITGVNLPMLLRSLCYAAEPLDALAARAAAGAAQGIVHLSYTPPQHQFSNSKSHAEDGHHHQQ
jgi:mannose PTS system EIIA component